jgi:hypothetical protein
MAVGRWTPLISFTDFRAAGPLTFDSDNVVDKTCFEEEDRQQNLQEDDASVCEGDEQEEPGMAEQALKDNFVKMCCPSTKVAPLHTLVEQFSTPFRFRFVREELLCEHLPPLRQRRLLAFRYMRARSDLEEDATSDPSSPSRDGVNGAYSKHFHCESRFLHPRICQTSWPRPRSRPRLAMPVQPLSTNDCSHAEEGPLSQPGECQLPSDKEAEISLNMESLVSALLDREFASCNADLQNRKQAVVEATPFEDAQLSVETHRCRAKISGLKTATVPWRLQADRLLCALHHARAILFAAKLEVQQIPQTLTEFAENRVKQAQEVAQIRTALAEVRSKLHAAQAETQHLKESLKASRSRREFMLAELHAIHCSTEDENLEEQTETCFGTNDSDEEILSVDSPAGSTMEMQLPRPLGKPAQGCPIIQKRRLLLSSLARVAKLC